jgi:hypothetical protein
MKPLARFVIRPTNKGPEGDLLIGLMFKKQNHTLLRANMVYELSDCLDTLIIRPVGEAAIGYDGDHSYLSSSWMHDISGILECEGVRFILTKEELEKLRDF